MDTGSTGFDTATTTTADNGDASSDAADTSTVSSTSNDTSPIEPTDTITQTADTDTGTSSLDTASSDPSQNADSDTTTNRDNYSGTDMVDTSMADSESEPICGTEITDELFCVDNRIVKLDACNTVVETIENCNNIKRTCYQKQCVCPDGWTGDSCTVPIIYVNAGIIADAGNNGRSWEQAFANLPKALEEAERQNEAEIWVAKGRYVPGNSRESTFQLTEDVHLYGGFAGDERLMAERDFELNETILDGDINGDDSASSFTMHSENAYHVVIGAEGALIDGVTIRGGNANGTGYPDNCGGGVLLEGTAMSIANCHVIENYAGTGGGMHLSSVSSLRLSNCRFEHNDATYDGGGLYEATSNLNVTDCTFINNSALGDGGGGYGGGAALASGTSHFSRCEFIENHAQAGGGLYARDSSASIENCLFSTNEAVSGAAVGTNTTTPGKTTTVQNCTVVNNYCEDSSAPIRVYGSATVTNSIVWGNRNVGGANPQLEVANNTSTITASDSIVEGGCPAVTEVMCDNVLNDTPGFTDPSTDNWRLSAGAFAVDAGDNQYVDSDETDLAGHSRIVDGDGDNSAIVDMGAYEFVP